MYRQGDEPGNVYTSKQLCRSQAGFHTPFGSACGVGSILRLFLIQVLYLYEGVGKGVSTCLNKRLVRQKAIESGNMSEHEQ